MADKAAAGAGAAAPAPASVAPTAAVSSPALASARRLIESFAIAVITSTGLYLVGSVYTDAYYGRMSIEVTSLDLSPPYLALQSIHVLQGLLEYPGTLLVLYGLYRVLSGPAGWLRAWYNRGRQRFGRAVLLLTNLLIVTPLVVDTVRASGDRRALPGNAVVSEASSLLLTVMLFLVAYVIWLSLGPRLSLIAEIRQRRVVPIGLVFLAYLLNALIMTSDAGARAAELLMLGTADTSVTVVFTPAADSTVPLPAAELMLVTLRGGNYFVVERQRYPPSLQPTAYVIPDGAVEFAQLRRLTAADLELDEATLEGLPIDLVPAAAGDAAPETGDP